MKNNLDTPETRSGVPMDGPESNRRENARRGDTGRISLEAGRLVIEGFATDVVETFAIDDPVRHPVLLESILEIGAAARLRVGARADFERLDAIHGELQHGFAGRTSELQDRLAQEIDKSVVTLTAKVDELFGVGDALHGLLDLQAPDGVVVALTEHAKAAALAEHEALTRLMDP